MRLGGRVDADAGPAVLGMRLGGFGGRAGAGLALFVAGNDGKPPFGKGRDETAAKRLIVSPG